MSYEPTGMAGIEPAAFSLGRRRSSNLSYIPSFVATCMEIVKDSETKKPRLESRGSGTQTVDCLPHPESPDVSLPSTSHHAARPQAEAVWARSDFGHVDRMVWVLRSASGLAAGDMDVRAP